MNEHTPGPWVARSDPDGGRDDYAIGTESGKMDGIAVCGARDAALIAAAPDLLEALQEFATQHKCGCGHPYCNDCARDAIADAALAKVSGLPPNKN